MPSSPSKGRVASSRDAERYDRAYFDKWYRSRRFRVKSPLDLRRQAAFIMATAEYMLERPVRSVLDVGCGEGNWMPVLRRLNPRIAYYGVDASEYAVGRFGKRRNIRLGTLATLGELGLPNDFDLVICCGVLNYVAPKELRKGLGQMRELLNGMAYLEIFTNADDATGDFTKSEARDPAWYRRVIADAQFTACGLHCYLPDELAGHAAALERAR